MPASQLRTFRRRKERLSIGCPLPFRHRGIADRRRRSSMRIKGIFAILALALAVGVTSLFGALSASSAYEDAHQVRKSIHQADSTMEKSLPTDLQGFENPIRAQAFPSFGH
jgi:hypothetical protein